MRELEQIVKAARLAAQAHAGQERRGLHEPYILHPMRVAQAAEAAGLSANAVAAAYLHDVVEDTGLTLDSLIQSGFHGETIALIDLLTKREGQGKVAYYARIVAEPVAAALKLLDRTDNLRDMERVVRLNAALGQWAARYLEKTRAEFTPLVVAVGHGAVTDAFDGAVWGLDKALTVASMADSLRPLAEPGTGP